MQALGFPRKRRDPYMAIRREELLNDYGRTGGRHRDVQSKNGVLGTYSEIPGVLDGDNPAGKELGRSEKLQKETREYEVKPRGNLLRRTSRLPVPLFVKKLTTRLRHKHVSC
jgi:hypothetical protein